MMMGVMMMMMMMMMMTDKFGDLRNGCLLTNYVQLSATREPSSSAATR
jgi:hypothetical protein